MALPLHAVAFASETLLRAPHWREGIEPVLQRLGETAEVSRVYVVCGETRIAEWVAPGTAVARREIAVAPIHVAGRQWGFIGFDDVADRTWSREELDGLAAVASILGAAIERSEREDREQAHAEERLRIAVEGARIGIWDFSPLTGESTRSDRVLEMLGLPPGAEFTRETFYTIVHPDDLQRVKDGLARALDPAGSGVYAIEFRAVHPDGSIRSLAARGRAIFDESGGPRVAVRLSGVLIDQTEEVGTLHTVQEQAETLRAIVEGAGIGIALFDAEGNMRTMNAALEEMFGYTAEELMRIGVAGVSHPDDLQRDFELFTELIEEKRSTYRLEKRYIHRNGEIRWGRLTVTRVDLPAGIHVVAMVEDITERTLAMRRLQESEERYALIARATNDVIWDWDVLAGQVEWNEAIATTLGYDRASVPPAPEWWYEHLHPDDYDRVVNGIRAAIEGRASFWSDEYRFRAADGSWRTFFDRGYIARDASGKAFRMIGAMLDLTERKQTEAELRARDLRYRSLVESSTQIVWTTNARGEIEDMPVWRALTGQTRDEVRGSGWLDALHPEDRARTWATWEHAYQTCAIYDTEYRIRMRDGSYRWFAARGIPVIDEDGTLREWVGTGTDIDERKRAEDALTFLADASATLATSLDFEATLRRIAALAVPRLADWAAVDLRTPDGRYERLAVEHRDPEKRQLAWDLWRRYSNRDDRFDVVREVLRTGKPILIERVSDELVRDAAYDEEHLRMLLALGLRSAIVVPLVAGGGRPIGTISFVSAESGRMYGESDLSVAADLARRAALAVENARLYRAAQDANRAKDEFLATLSHELRTPLTAILGWAKILTDDRGDAELFAQGLETIHRSAIAQARLVDDVLDVSRIISGKLRLEPQPTDVTSIVDASVEAVAPASRAKGIAVRVHHDQRALIVLADPNRLQQVVWNLLSNAIKFTEPGGRVEVTTGIHGEAAAIAVSDTGPGIAPEFLPHVFEPFRQAESSTTRVHGGLGLGLAIVRYLVESHGGRVSAYSEGVGRGSQFTIELPLRAAGRIAAQQEMFDRAAAQAPRGPAADLAGVRVLFVDDQEDTREFAAVALRRHGAEVTLAATVGEALDAFARQPFDVVISDIAMPERDGYELLAALREHTRVPVLAISAFGHPEDVDRARAAGFDGYIRKPVDPDDLVRSVAAARPV